MMKPGKKKNKNVSYFSHEYIITNHGDIVSFVAMIIILGLMFHVTAPLAKLFIVLHHNVTVNDSQSLGKELIMYTTGRKDLFGVVFYTLIAIVIHAVIQEYILDKLNRKLHLSKVKHSKVNESGQLVIFYLFSAIWGLNIIFRERLITSIASLWESYPHAALSFWFKFFFISQICYWLHCFPEIYFQKIKKEEMPARITYYSLYFFCVLGAYVLNLNRLGILLLVLHYSVEFIFHTSRLLYFSNKFSLAKAGFIVWDILFVLIRVVSVALTFVTFFHGLDKSSQERISFNEGNFNTKFIRINCLAFVCLLQGYMMWNFITFHIRRLKEYLQNRARQTTPKKTKKAGFDKKAKKLAAAQEMHDEDNELTEADRQYPEFRKKKV